MLFPTFIPSPKTSSTEGFSSKILKILWAEAKVKRRLLDRLLKATTGPKEDAIKVTTIINSPIVIVPFKTSK